MSSTSNANKSSIRISDSTPKTSCTPNFCIFVWLSNNSNLLQTFLHDGRLTGSLDQHSEYNWTYFSGVPGTGLSREPFNLYSFMLTVAVNPSQGSLPLEISHRITPKLKISDFSPHLY